MLTAASIVSCRVDDSCCCLISLEFVDCTSLIIFAFFRCLCILFLICFDFDVDDVQFVHDDDDDVQSSGSSRTSIHGYTVF